MNDEPVPPGGRAGAPPADRVGRGWHLVALLTLAAMAALNMSGWLTRDLLPAYDFGGYVSMVEHVRDVALDAGRVPSWSAKWFGGSSRFMSALKELATLPLAVWLGPLRGTQLMVMLLKVLAGMAMYAVFVRFFRSPTAGIVAGYAYAFSTPANYDTSIHLHVSLSYVLFPLICIACVELLRGRRTTWAVGLGALAACQFANNSVLVAICLAMGLFLLVLRPWRLDPREDNPCADLRLGRRWCVLLAAALGVFALFAGSQLAWIATDLKNHALHDPAQVAEGIDVFIEHSPFVYFNRGNWLGPWLARHHPPNMPLFPDEPLRGQRHYLGGIAMIVCAVGWFLARRHFSLRRWCQTFSLLFLLQYGLSTGPRTLLWQIARTFHWPDTMDGGLHTALTVASVSCVAWAALLRLRHRRGPHEAATARIELALGLGLLLFFASHSLFDMARDAVPVLAGMRAPGRFFELAPFAFYGLFGTSLVAIERALAVRRYKRQALAVIVGVLLVVDFWPGTAAFRRGTSMEPVRDFREVVADLPAEDGTLRAALFPWFSPTSWVASSLVLTGSNVGAAWSWLPWQASPYWPAYFRAAMLWLAQELDPAERELYRPVSDTLGRIGRIKYVLDELDGGPALRLEPPWQRRAANQRFALWERPDVMPVAAGYRAYILFVGDTDLAQALSIQRAFGRNLATLSGGARLSETPAIFIQDAVAVVCNGPGPLADDTSRVLGERHAGKVLVTDAPDFGERFPAILTAAAFAPLVEVRYSRPAPEHIVLEMDAGSQPAVAFVSEAYHPWWRVTVDGQPGSILRAQMAFMAVPAGPGRHVIDMRFEPPLPVRAADAITMLSWIVLALGLPAYGTVRFTRRRASLCRPREATRFGGRAG